MPHTNALSFVPDVHVDLEAVLTGSGVHAGLRLYEPFTTSPTDEDYEVLAWVEPVT